MKKSRHLWIVVIVFLVTGIAGWTESTLGQNVPWENSYWKAKCSFSRIYAFGDSLTDTGNFFDLTGEPPEPYFQGRLSNGYVWIEYLSKYLGINDDDVTNYAFAGATTGRDNTYDIPDVADFPGLQDQLDFFESGLQGEQADPDALYVVWAGANDFFVNGASPETIGTAIQNLVLAVQRLHFAGAKHILVLNLPDLGRTPFGRATDPEGLSFLTSIFNSELSNALDQISSLGISTIRVDVVEVLNSIEANPKRYGFSNVTDSYLDTGEGDPNQYLYWDSVHPTTRGHRVTAIAAFRVLASYRFQLLIQQFIQKYAGT